MHTHAPKTFKRSHKRKREKRNESQSRGERQKRTKSVAVLAFFLPTVLCVFVLWCMGTLALTSSIRSPQVAAADEEKGVEEETAGAAGALAYAQITCGALANAG